MLARVGFRLQEMNLSIVLALLVTCFVFCDSLVKKITDDVYYYYENISIVPITKRSNGSDVYVSGVLEDVRRKIGFREGYW